MPARQKRGTNIDLCHWWGGGGGVGLEGAVGARRDRSVLANSCYLNYGDSVHPPNMEIDLHTRMYDPDFGTEIDHQGTQESSSPPSTGTTEQPAAAR